METNCCYDIIFGQDFCIMYGIVLDFESQEMQTLNAVVPMQHELLHKLGEPSHAHMLEIELDDSLQATTYEVKQLTVPINSSYKSKVFVTSKSNKVDLALVIHTQEHLSASQQDDLLCVLNKHPCLFDGGLGRFNKYKIELELKPDTQPKAAHAYPVPHHHMATYKA